MPRIFLIVAIAAVGCDYGHYDPPPVDETSEPTQTGAQCSEDCHGSDDNPAPPFDTAGNTDTTATGVGAHQAHLSGSDWHKQFSCNECHQIPASVDAPGHMDTPLPAELTFGELSGQTQWDGEACTNSYCHGGSLSGGAFTEPIWTQVDGNQNDCGSCHGAPPPAPHPDDPECATCHPTMNPGEGMVIAYPELHIDGHLDVIGGAPCDSCHGSNGISAPPTDVDGASSTSLVTVGAHRSHLGTSDWHMEMQCTDCHKVPTGTADVGHIDTPRPAELTFSDLAGPAVWNGSSCSDSYCHGATNTGGTDTTPVWTQLGGTQTQCGSCHGAPPPAPHPSDSDCGKCHPSMNPGDGLVIAYPELHINGALDVNTDQPCDACHGSNGVSAPPVDVSGNTDTALSSVGAHRRHLGVSSWHKEVECSACHKVPTAVVAIGHMDTPLPAELTFGDLGTGTQYNGTSCSDSYCHGATMSGGVATSPVWTQLDGAQGQCNACHGSPPPAPHPANGDCGQCHDTMNPGEGLVIADPSRHIDGNIDVNTDQACDACHGGGGNDAPPVDLAGGSATNRRGVGAHQNHLGASSWHKEIECSECHKVPTAVLAVGHMDTLPPAELTFGALGGNIIWTGNSCSGSYCHGAGLGGGDAKTPVWTTVDGSQSQCDSCHGSPPPAPHPTGDNCGLCHDDAGNGPVITDPSRHIDGNLDVDDTQACDSCHGSGGDAAPPVDTLGNTNTTARGVGAHRSHLQTSDWHKPIECTQCHNVPDTVNSVGHIDTPAPAELNFKTLASGTSFNGTTCTSSYCHGSTLAGGSATAPAWAVVDGSQSSCGSCHGLPPPAPHPNDTNCQQCHGDVAGPNQTIIAPLLHIDGQLQVDSVHPANWVEPTPIHGDAFNQDGPGSCATAACHGVALDGGASGVGCNDCHSGWQTNCTFCHGGTDNLLGAPPESVDGSLLRSNPAVGAHTIHVEATSSHLAYGCDRCHTAPASAVSPNHIDGDAIAEVVFSSLNSAGTYSTSSNQCSNLYCHGSGVQNSGAVDWVSTQALACNSCHGSPPRTGEHGDHHKGYDCDECHESVAGGNDTLANRLLHIDGINQVQISSGGTYDPSGRGTCSNLSCHGRESWR